MGSVRMSCPDSALECESIPATILVVEANDEVRRVVTFGLRQAGYVVLEAANGEGAIEVASQRLGPINVLVTEVRMPRMGGRLLADKLISTRPGMKVLFISGYEDEAVEEKSFLQKPFTPRTLIGRISSMVKNN